MIDWSFLKSTVIAVLFMDFLERRSCYPLLSEGLHFLLLQVNFNHQIDKYLLLHVVVFSISPSLFCYSSLTFNATVGPNFASYSACCGSTV